MEQQKEAGGPHVLILPYPSQGHINPMLQFGKRLASHGVRITLAVTRFTANSARSEPSPLISVECWSDGFDQGGFAAAGSVKDYLDRMESVGSKTLADMLESLRSRGKPVQALVYDSFLPWARDVADRSGLRTASFFTQPCVVNGAYCHWQLWEGRLRCPVTEPVQLAPGLPWLEPGDLPSFLSDVDSNPTTAYLSMLLDQYKNLDKADAVLINSFYELEPEEFKWMQSRWRVKSIGPTVPSAYVDNQIPSDSHYSFNLYPLDSQPYLPWLDSKPPGSVVYASFGSMASLSPAQTAELAGALAITKHSFLWVVRSSELAKLPETFQQEVRGRGLLVTWCNQLDVLSHKAVGCFLTHCGWNSTLEGIVMGVPMVGMPQWTDQPTNAKYIEDVWRVGVRVKADGESGEVRAEEVVKAIGEVMAGERREEVRRNAAKWRESAKKAVREAVRITTLWNSSVSVAR